MSSEPTVILRQLAAQFHTKLKASNIGDANAGGSSDPFCQMLTYKREGRKMRILANNTWVNASVAGMFQISPISINKDDRIFLLRVETGKLLAGTAEYPIFTGNGELTVAQKELFKSSKLLETIRIARLNRSESFHANRGELNVYLVRPSLERLMAWLSGIFEIANEMERPSAKSEINLKSLPRQFHPLIPLVEKWGVGDDLEREELLEKTSTTVLCSLVSEVEPYLSAIDSYLDSFKTDPPSHACALGRLAECELEAKLLLRQQKGSA